MIKELPTIGKVNPEVNAWNFIGNHGAFRMIEAQREELKGNGHRRLDALPVETETVNDLLQMVRYITTGDASAPIGIQEIEAQLKTVDRVEIEEQEARVANFLIERFKLPPNTSKAHIDTYQKIAAQHAEELAEQERNRLLLVIEGIKSNFKNFVRSGEVSRSSQRQALNQVNKSIDLITDLHAALEWQQEVKASRGIRQILRTAFDDELTFKARSEAQAKLVTTLHGIGEIVASENQNGIMDELYGILNSTGFWYKPNQDSKADQLHDRDVFALHNSETGECMYWTGTDPIIPEPGFIVMRHAMPYREVRFGDKIIEVEVTSRYKEITRAIAKGGIKNGAISDDSNGLRFIVRDVDDIPMLMGKLIGSLRKSGVAFDFSQHGYTQNVFEEGFMAITEDGHSQLFEHTENKHNRATSSKRRVLQFDLIIEGRSIEVQVLTVQDHLNTRYNKEFFHEGYYVRKLFQNGEYEPLITRLFNDDYISYLMDILNMDTSQRIKTLNNPFVETMMKEGAHRKVMGSDRPAIMLTALQVEWERTKAQLQFLWNLVRKPHVYGGLIDHDQLRREFDILISPNMQTVYMEIVRGLTR